MRNVENENFVVKDTFTSQDRVAIGNLKAYGEGMYINEEQIDDLIKALQIFKQQY